MIVALAGGLAAVAAPLRAQTGTDSLRRAAHAAEVRYERTARWLAPGTYGMRGGKCDEIVGRFCLNFDSLSKPPTQPERAEIGAARAQALAAFRSFAAASPGELDAAGPLVRLLVEARRADEAVAAAATFAAGTRDSLWGDWLSGFALHGAGRDRQAAARFERALARAPAAERAEIAALDWLLSPGERNHLKHMTPAASAQYRERFWRLADPMWLTRENEVWVEHVARHVEARLLARVPLVTGMLRWGRDLDELTVRYGAPIARERDWGSDSWSFIEHFDTSALAYAPESLHASELAPLLPGERWRLAWPSARSSHAPPAIRAAVPLVHQLTRIPAGDAMLVRVDAAVALDGTGGAPAVLVAWPWRGGQEIRDSTVLGAGAAGFSLSVRVPRDSMIYAVECLEPATRKLHRARYLLAPLATGEVELSDILLTHPVPDSAAPGARFEALTATDVPADQPVGIRVTFVGIRAGTPMAVDVSYARAAEPPLLLRAMGWVGRRLGLGAERGAPRVRWQAAAPGDSVLHVNLITPRRPGLYYVQVAVRAPAGEAVTRRLVRVVSASAEGP